MLIAFIKSSDSRPEVELVHSRGTPTDVRV